jgi:hypothetical protein
MRTELYTAIDSYVDDLGEYYGDTDFKHGGMAREDVLNWTITAVGNRPSDHMQRDLWVSSQLRDPRMWLIKKLIKGPLPWIGRRTLGMKKLETKLMTQLTACHYAHSLHLHQLAECVPARFEKVIEQLRRCFPIGCEVVWDGPGRRGGNDICRRARQCPFCFVRAVSKLYDRLAAARQGQTADAYLLARITIPDHLIVCRGNLSLREQCELVERHIHKALVKQFRTLGVDGGLLTFQVGPRQNKVWIGSELQVDPEAGFEFKLSALGRITRDTQQLVQVINGEVEGLDPIEELGGKPLDATYFIDDRPDALRFMLFGSSISYTSRDGVGNIVGAFDWPSWSLSDQSQWTSHLDATKGMRQFTFWGNWVGSISETPRPISFLLPVAVRRAYRTREVFARHNEEVRSSAISKADQIQQAAEAILENSPDAHQYGRVRLRDHLAERGLVISERDVRQLLQRLRGAAENSEGVAHTNTTQEVL